jgi:release factor glutamine methyltransferase
MDQETYTVGGITREYREELSPLYGEKEVLQFLYLLFDAWKGLKRVQVHDNREEGLTNAEYARFRDALLELKKCRPIQHILGETWFCGLRLKVTPAVLIPRPETEELVGIITDEIKREERKHLEILDIGTGSGCIAISLKKNFPEAGITGTEVSPEALKVAEENTRINRCAVNFLINDILDQKSWAVHPNYHLIVSNPPYVTLSEKALMHRNVLDYEPANALFVPDNDPLVFYRTIARFASDHLETGGRLYFEINERFPGEIRELLSSNGFHEVETIPDIHNKPRFAKAVR